jgi:hypothetical protein
MSESKRGPENLVEYLAGISADAKVALEKFEQQRQQENMELLGLLGEEFDTCWDVLMQEDGPLDKKEEKKFFEAALLIQNSPYYLEYIKRLIKDDMEDLAERQSKQELTEKEATAEMRGFAISFKERLEFFCRLKAPERITSGGRTAGQLEAELRQANIDVVDIAHDILRSKEFITSKEQEQIDLVRLRVEDLFPDTDKNPSTNEIYEKAKELGLELCSAEVGPAYRLAYHPEGELKKEQPTGEWLNIAMEPAAHFEGENDWKSYIFRLERNRAGVWLDTNWTNPTANRWRLGSHLVFRLRPEKKSEK